MLIGIGCLEICGCVEAFALLQHTSMFTSQLSKRCFYCFSFFCATTLRVKLQQCGGLFLSLAQLSIRFVKLLTS
jgi:hypothetical protein